MFALIWRDAALDELADAWVAADPSTRDEIERVVKGLNRRLGNDPLQVGESRFGGYRVAIEAPVAIVFHVDASDQVVHVVHF
jgi:hypothetical protein